MQCRINAAQSSSNLPQMKTYLTMLFYHGLLRDLLYHNAQAPGFLLAVLGPNLKPIFSLCNIVDFLDVHMLAALALETGAVQKLCLHYWAT